MSEKNPNLAAEEEYDYEEEGGDEEEDGERQEDDLLNPADTTLDGASNATKQLRNIAGEIIVPNEPAESKGNRSSDGGQAHSSEGRQPRSSNGGQTHSSGRSRKRSSIPVDSEGNPVYIYLDGPDYDDYYSDDWPSYFDDDDGDEELDEIPEEVEGEDTIEESPEPSEESIQPKIKKPPVELGKRSFRWFERKILGNLFPPKEENLRRKQILEKCQMVRRVSKPLVTLMDAKSKLSSKDSGLLGPEASSKKASQDSIEEGIEDGNEEEEGSDHSKTFRDYTEREWAIKNTIDFLTSQGCDSTDSRSYRSSLKAQRDEADFRLNLYETQLKRRRNAIGNSQGAPEITAALRRHAERAVWRAVIDNTKPRYPLPKFILPRHKYLKKVQAQFIGPGSYELDVFEKSTKLRQMNLPSTWASCTARFSKDKDGEGDEDGAGGKGGKAVGGTILLDPWEALDKANMKKKYPGNYIPFESTPKNFRKGFMEGGSRIPPNAYNIKSPMEEFLEKKTSLRGPYDLYTPSRGIIPYGHHKSQNDEEKGRLGPGSYEIRASYVKEFNDPYNYFKGVLGKADRSKMFGFKACFDNPLWPKLDDFSPAVGQYDPDTEAIGQDKEQEMAPFKTQSGLKKKPNKVENMVGPDYYYYYGAGWTVPPKGANLASVFKSKSPQIMPAKMHQVAKERNKACNSKFDLERLADGDYQLEEHYAYDKSYKNTYALEDCKDPCLMPKGGPKVDLFAIPGIDLGSVRGAKGGCGC